MSNEKLNSITPKILPENSDFSDEQKRTIFFDEPANIIAGPGTGKTTVLIAKCALLLKDRIDSRGICLITHTNVAVEEIKLGLKKIGIDNLEYPNFIGTIQEFFNSFFGRKAFYILHKGQEKTFRILDDHEYKEKFDELFNLFKPNWYNYPNPNPIERWSFHINVFEDMTYKIDSDVNDSYKDSYIKSITKLFEFGYVTNTQALELANWYINKYIDEIVPAIANRFSHVMLDEAQDTSKLQYDMLEKLFMDSDVIFQKYGDPYQALYNLFDDTEDAWIPAEEENIDQLQISETSRFGDSIANIVKNVCVEKYETFESLNLVESFLPFYIIYEDTMDLFKQYEDIINYYEETTCSFKSSTKQDKALSFQHADLEKLSTDYVRPTISVKKTEGEVKTIYHFLLKILSKKLNLSFFETKKEFDSKLEYKVILAKNIKKILNEEINYDNLLSDLNDLLFAISSKPENTLIETDLKNRIINLQNTDGELNNPNNFELGTIHSVKGETHRSTLLILNSILRSGYGESPSYPIFTLLKSYLIGQHIDVQTIEDIRQQKETIKALKLAYVALSRPTHLMGIAIPSEIIDQDSEIVDNLNSNGWIQSTDILTNQ